MRSRFLFVVLGLAAALASPEGPASADNPPEDQELLAFDPAWSGCYLGQDFATGQWQYTFYARLTARGWKWKYYYYYAKIYDVNLGQWRDMTNPTPNRPPPADQGVAYLMPYDNRNYEGDLQSNTFTYTVPVESLWGQLILHDDWGGDLQGRLFLNEQGGGYTKFDYITLYLD
jgi:hypothetical protein